jgi:hypothetical protein
VAEAKTPWLKNVSIQTEEFQFLHTAGCAAPWHCQRRKQTEQADVLQFDTLNTSALIPKREGAKAQIRDSKIVSGLLPASHQRSPLGSHDRTTRHGGYVASQRIEEAVGWIKTVAGQHKTKFRSRDRVGWAFTFAATAHNLVRLPKLRTKTG